VQKKGRAAGWSKETVLRELRDGAKITDICAQYAAGASPKSLRTEVDRWRAEDPDFKQKYTEAVGDKQMVPRGSTAKDLLPENADWRLRYCEELYREADSVKAAAATPYDFDTISKKLSQSFPDMYDPDFAAMVQEVRMKICAEMERRIVNAARDPLASPRDVAWIGFRWLERQDASKWGRQVEMIHKGTITHEHAVKPVTREDRLANLLSEQATFMGRSAQPALTSGQRDCIDVDAVVVRDADAVPAVTEDAPAALEMVVRAD
jgi:hypothetical protein